MMTWWRCLLLPLPEPSSLSVFTPTKWQPSPTSSRQGRSIRSGHSGFGRCTFPSAEFFHRAAFTGQQTAGEWGVRVAAAD